MGMSPRLLRPRAAAAAAPSGPSDPYFSSVALLLHMEGANGSTTFTDSSSSVVSVTANGDAAISTTAAKWGAGSMLTASGSISVPSPDFGVGDFTIEAWVYLNAKGSSTFFSQLNAAPSPFFHFYSVLFEGGGLFLFYGDGTVSGQGVPIDDLFTVETWQHVALVRSNGTLSFYIDGTLSGSISNPADMDGAQDLYFGSLQGGEYVLDGRMDDIRVTKGVARYTSNFTPPDAPFPDQ